MIPVWQAPKLPIQAHRTHEFVSVHDQSPDHLPDLEGEFEQRGVLNGEQGVVAEVTLGLVLEGSAFLFSGIEI